MSYLPNTIIIKYTVKERVKERVKESDEGTLLATYVEYVATYDRGTCFSIDLCYISIWRCGEKMKIIINIDKNVSETEITIHCNQLSDEIENIMATLRIMNQQMLVCKDEENYLLDVSLISYIEALERKTFVYTEEDVFESKLKLYEMEEKLCESGFFRISKSCLVNMKYIKTIRKDVERRIRLTLKNGEQIMVSRQYAEEIKRRLGVL